MARLLSPVASIMRGSVAGLTFTANTFHQIVVRQRTSPVQPGTNPQSRIRSAFTAASVLWKDATPTVRAAWDDYAKTLFYPGPLGPYQVPGRSVFISNLSLCYYLYLAGLMVTPPSTEPPTIAGFLSTNFYGYVPPTTPGTGYELNVNNPNDEPVLAICERSWAYELTRQFFKGPFVASTIVAPEVEPSTTETIPFLSLTANRVYFNKCRLLSSTAPFRVSPLFYIRAIASTTPAP